MHTQVCEDLQNAISVVVIAITLRLGKVITSYTCWSRLIKIIIAPCIHHPVLILIAVASYNNHSGNTKTCRTASYSYCSENWLKL